jgi:hypothetical protein
MNSCEKCGSLVPAEKAFCPNCGAAMMQERQRAPEDSGEMGETIYDAPPPPKLQAPKPTIAPVTQEPASTAQAQPSSTYRPPAAPDSAAQPKKAATVNAPAADSNRMLNLILRLAASLFVLSILVVAILYMMGRI